MLFTDNAFQFKLGELIEYRFEVFKVLY